MTENKDVWVYSEKPALQAELIACARQLTSHTGGQAIAVVLGPRSLAEQTLRQGAQRVIWLGELASGRLVEDLVPTLAAGVQAKTPFGLIIGATIRGRAVAGRLAARLGVAALADVLEFQWDGPALLARHMVFGGGAVRIDRPLASPVIATVGQGIFEASALQAQPNGEIETLPWVEPPWQAAVIERRSRAVSSVNLSAAKRVVCPGRGVARQEDLSMIEELAQALSAEMACTRPLAEGLGWLPRERYIGISGAMVKPDLYIGVGVSGQAQHTIGMSESRVVVAINKDRHAPLVSQSDYAVEGDLYQVVPALIRALKARKA
jgi:electron transfer flavoprotein alpha subunit